jgi:DNA-binding MarR family transcriptional regulator
MNNSVMNPLVFSLLGAAQGIERQFEEALATIDLSGAKFAALSVLASQGQPISLSELAGKLSCVRSNVTQLVDRMEKEGLVNRVDDPADRRGVQAQVTPAGRERFKAGQKATAVVWDAIAQKLAGVDLQALEAALKALR